MLREKPGSCLTILLTLFLVFEGSQETNPPKQKSTHGLCHMADHTQSSHILGHI